MSAKPSKPHLLKLHGVWHCGITRTGTWQRLGLGHTPAQAYEDWKKGGAQ